ncbi:MAG: TIGR01777 family protein [Williamsia sp.]|nr:TIGR01777 family protein [Williamsia sp.]
MQTVLITGGTGLIGRQLTRHLISKGYQVIVLTRELPTEKANPPLRYALWDIEQQTIDKDAILQADYIVHLAGANVGEKRWTKKRKEEIVSSRIQSSALLIKGLTENGNKVRALISASAIGWYGEDPRIPNPHPFVETDPPDEGFLGHTCKLWEDSIQPVTGLDIRLVILRTGLVLDNSGGVLAAFKKPVYFGLAGILGNGKQIMSWIHVDDICQMYLAAIEQENLHGPYNAVAPKPVSNKELTLHLAKTMKGKFYVSAHVPGFLLETALGEMSTEVLKSTTVCCDKIRKAGYNFKFPTLEGAIDDLIKKK